MKFKRSSLMTKIIIVLPAIAAAATLVSLQAQLRERQATAAELEQQVAAASQENWRMEAAIDAVDTDEGVKAIAREKLGMVESGEIIFYDIGG